MPDATGTTDAGTIETGNTKSVDNGTETNQGTETKETKETPWYQTKAKIKVNGKEEEIDFSAMTKDDMLRHIQMGKASHEKFETAAKMDREIKKLITDLNDPNTLQTALKRLASSNPKVREAVEKYLASELEVEMMDPKDKQLREMQEKLESYENEKKEKEQAEINERRKKLESETQKRIGDSILKALNDKKIPASIPFTKRVAEYMGIIANQYNMKVADIPMEPVIDAAFNSYKTDVNQLLSSMPGEQILSFITPEILNKIRLEDLKRLRGTAITPENLSQAKETTRIEHEDKPRKYISESEWRKKFESV